MTEAVRLSLEPFLGWPIIWALATLTLAAWTVYFFLRGRAWLTRAVGLLVISAALLNPTLVHEEREPLPSVAALILDKSESMQFGERDTAAAAAYEALKARLSEDPSLKCVHWKPAPAMMAPISMARWKA